MSERVGYTGAMGQFLGIDIGTSATKAIIIDEEGTVRGVAESPHAISMPRAGWSEQDPDDWWRAAVHATRNALQVAGAERGDIAAVGLSGQMHGSVFLPRDTDPRDPRPLRPALLWNDQRTAAQCEAITDAVGRERLLEITGNRALTGFTAPKLLWLRDEEPAIFARLGLLLLPKDYVRFRLTDVAAIDVGDASGTLLLDLRTRNWNDEIVRAINCDRAILPPVVESATVSGTVSEHAAKSLGVRAGIPVVAGSGDQMTGAVGMGIVREGLVSATVGTSGVIFAHAGGHVPSPLAREMTGEGGDASTLQCMCAAVPAEYCIYGCMLSAAGALSWFRDACAPGVSFAQLDEEAAATPPGADGLIFLPYLTGERCPYADPLARGAFVGLTSRHTRGHMARAVMEGVAFGMAQILDLIRATGVEPAEIRLSGGGAKSGLWRRIQASAYGAPVALLNTSEGSAYGAAILAGVGSGAWKGVAEGCSACISVRERAEPQAAVASTYEAIRPIHSSLYFSLKASFAELVRPAADLR
jgi:xylulokinase